MPVFLVFLAALACNRTTAAAPPAVVRTSTAQQWVELASLNEPRQEVAVAELGGRIYVAGGFRRDGSTSDAVEAYDPASDSWSLRARLPLALNHATAASVNDRLYVIGGHPPSGPEAVDAVFAYDPGADRWEPRAPMPTARGSLAVAVVDGKIYAAGGSPDPRERDFAVYDPAADSWTVLPPMPTPRNHLAAAAANGRFYAVGGRSGSIAGITPILEEFDPATNAWTRRASMPTARGGIAGASAAGRVYVFGGEGNPNHPLGVFEQAEAYDPATDSWQSLSPMLIPAHGISATVLDNVIYIPGGAIQEGFGVAPIHQALRLDWATSIRFRPEIALTRLALAELLIRGSPMEQSEAQEHLDFAIAEFRAMKMQPALERALGHKGLLRA
jgi:N-acetylneuraminic acid mutarotase